jgi:hypothetical protein
MAPVTFFKAKKWKCILKSLSIKISVWESFKIIIISYFIGSLTPGRVGDFSRALYLKKEGDSNLIKGFSSTLIDRIFDIGFLIILSFFSIIFLINFYSFSYSSMITIIIVAIAFAFGLLLLLKKTIIRKLLRPFFYMLIPEKFQSKLRNAFDDFYSSILIFIKNKRAVFSLSFFTILTWLFGFLSMYFGAMALNIPVTYFHMILILPFTTLVEALPISFSGVGTRDAVLILMFTLLGISSSLAVSFSIMILILNYIMNLFGVLFWIKNPFKLS